jgi:hypothetical protein
MKLNSKNTQTSQWVYEVPADTLAITLDNKVYLMPIIAYNELENQTRSRMRKALLEYVKINGIEPLKIFAK